jgi:hypothetical protein
MALRRHLSWCYALAAQILRARPDSRFSGRGAAPELRRRWRRKHANRIQLAVFDNESLDLSGATGHKDANPGAEADANPDTEAIEGRFTDAETEADADRYSDPKVHAAVHPCRCRANSDGRNRPRGQHREPQCSTDHPANDQEQEVLPGYHDERIALLEHHGNRSARPAAALALPARPIRRGRARMCLHHGTGREHRELPDCSGNRRWQSLSRN